jgi:hypothetical protein
MGNMNYRQLGIAVSMVSSILVLPAMASEGSLTVQVGIGQQRLEQAFSMAPSMVELVHASPTSNAVVDYGDLQDSAIWTGAYLASQCFRESAASDAADQADAANQIQWALSSVERLFNVTGTPGLLSRFAFNTADPNVKGLGFTKTANAANGWLASKSMPGWMWLADVSRDQYTGVLFGLGVCNQITTNSNVRSRTSAAINAAVSLLYNNKWQIPASLGSQGTSANATGFIEVAWLKLAALSASTASAQASWQKIYVSTVNLYNNNIIDALEEDLDPTMTSNVTQYYAWNLSYMRFYPLLAYETNTSYLNYLKSLMTSKMWNETWSHENTFFTYLKMGTMGIQNNDDQVAMTQAKTSLEELAVRNRRDFPVNNTNNASLGRSSLASKIGSLATKYNLNSISYVAGINPVQADTPIPMSSRAPDDFMWEISPFQLTGGGTGTIEAAPVDTIIAYWLGRHYQFLSAQD